MRVVEVSTAEQGRQTRDRIMVAIVQYIGEHGYPPSVREIGAMVGLKSTSSVFAHMQRLITEGKLETDADLGTSRAIRVPGYKFVKDE